MVWTIEGKEVIRLGDSTSHGGKVLMFEISQGQIGTIKNLIINIYKGRSSFGCTSTISSVLKESGGVFMQLPGASTPWGLASDLSKVR